MSKKKLLEESTIRSFMKLANLAPLTDKFLNEASEEEEEGKKEEEEEELDEELAPPADPRRKETGQQEESLKEEEEMDEGEVTEEGKESEGRASSPRPKVKGVQKPGKMDAAKNAPGDAKMKPLKTSSHHSDKPDSIETKNKSNAPKKNNSQFEIVSESLEEEMPDEAADMSPEAGATPSDTAGESEEHQDTVKDALKKMLSAMQQIASEYGVDMSVASDEGGEDMPGGEEEAGSPESTGAEEDMPGGEEEDKALEEAINKLTKRVAARLVGESKKKK